MIDEHLTESLDSGIVELFGKYYQKMAKVYFLEWCIPCISRNVQIVFVVLMITLVADKEYLLHVQ